MKYLLINWEDKTVWQTDDLEDINQGYSVKAVDLADLEDNIQELVKEELDRERDFDRIERDEAIYNRKVGGDERSIR